MKIKVLIGILAALILFIFCCKPLYYRLYLGDRITGNIKVIIDNEVHYIENNDIAFSESGKVAENKDGSANIKIHAGKYGKYALNIDDIITDVPVNIGFIQGNWWEVQRFEITVSVDTVHHLITYSGYSINLTESKNKRPISTTFDYMKEYPSISIGL